MQESKYLASGEKLGGHYEIVKVLGEDDFEILYLVKDKHLKDKLFVLKELFLEGISLRDNQGGLYSLAKSKYVFDETKKEVILEAKKLQESNQKQEIELYGYFEENNTVYTIMEFSNDSNLEHYLQLKSTIEVAPQEEIVEPKTPIQENKAEIEKENKKSPLFLIGLIILVAIFAGLAYYAVKIIEEDKEKSKKRPSTTTVEVLPHTPKPLSHPTLTTRDNRTKKLVERREKNETNRSNDTLSSINNIDNVAYQPPSTKAYVEKNSTLLKGVPKEEIYVDTESDLNPIDLTPVVAEEQFNQKSVGLFLGRFSDALSNASVDRILSFYDTDVQKYFKFTRVKHDDIRIDREAYNKKWEYRDFRVGSFKILKTYTEHRVEYCDVEVRTKWSVSTSNFKSDLGVSIEWITLKKTPNGFKIKSIYLLK